MPNLFLQNEDFFIGDRIPLSVSPSLTWLNETINQNNDNTDLRAWISDDDSEKDNTLKTLTEIYLEEKVLEEYNISLDTSHYLPKNLTKSKMIMITAHGGIDERSNNFTSISDEGSIKLHYRDFAENVSNNELVILFVCNAGRFDNHPYQSSTISLQRELLRQGCHTIIASPWPLDSFMTTKWFKLFLQKWINKALTVSQAVHSTNNELLNQDFDPSKYLALNVYGNPFKKYN